jgi:hypothetical protein
MTKMFKFIDEDRDQISEDRLREAEIRAGDHGFRSIGWGIYERLVTNPRDRLSVLRLLPSDAPVRLYVPDGDVWEPAGWRGGIGEEGYMIVGELVEYWDRMARMMIAADKWLIRVKLE